MDREWPEDETVRAVVEVLTFVGLQDELEKQAEELSGGMKRRLELARALIGWPSIMLFDEPTAGLDPINARPDWRCCSSTASRLLDWRIARS
jgi:ABC-type multidrug transport system ATPase subunit